MSETNEPRGINELIDLPYSEMTEEEISIVIEWKAANKARDDAYRESINAINERTRQLAEIAKNESEKHISALKQMQEQSRAFYESAGI